MAGKKISELLQLNELNDSDLVIIVETDADGNPSVTKRTTIAAFRDQLTSTIGGDTYALQTNTYTKSEVNTLLTDTFSGESGSLPGYNNTDWDDAFSWGDHSLLGYQVTSQKGVANGYAPLDGVNQIPATHLSYAMSSGHPAAGVTNTRLSNWDTAFGWGNHTNAGYEFANQKGVANGYAPLGSDNKIPNSYLPALAITTTKVFADNTLRDAWSDAEEGDVAIVGTDNMTSYIMLGTGVWQELQSSSWVDSVHGKTGAVWLNYDDVGALPNTHPVKDLTTQNVTELVAQLPGNYGHHGQAGYAFDNAISAVGKSGSYLDLANKPNNATTTTAGFMSSGDKLNLDTIVANLDLGGGSGLYVLKTDLAASNKDGLLSKEDFVKLSNIADGAEVNVQSDWNVTDNTLDTFIQNKPTTWSYNNLTDVPTEFTPAPHTHSLATQTTNGYMSATDKIKIDSVDSGANVNVQADWNALAGSDAEILNKPTITGLGAEVTTSNQYSSIDAAMAATPSNAVFVRLVPVTPGTEYEIVYREIL